ncbi:MULTISPECIES: transporter [unclassified Pseudomonas]|uniref:transporter n=1 Tax=unclassified Pseudomonas TaxID=196821 RepID=UPI00191151F2|nr:MULTISPECIES: transporter [unclassified Pseudomonas]MBK5549092.1 transporter [Pseudomonas sp. TH03]MEB0223034.1 transporter [Pseudomonas sp. 5S1]MEB0293560.1 transporter [Pseudomonas sp. 10S4]
MNKIRLLTLPALLPAFHAQAVEVAPGDYEQYPADATIGVIYYQHATTDSAYAKGHKVSSDFNLSSDVGILRLLHVYALSDTVTIDPQFLLPFGHVSSGGDASTLGSTSGIGDLILTAPVKLRLNDARDTLSLAPYLFVPTGSYDKDAPLNIGENRWKFELQGAYVKHFTEKWAMDLVGGATWYGDNDDYSANANRLEQDVSYAAQVMGRYMPDATTAFGIGFGHTWGGETNIEHVNQDNEADTTNFRLTATKFFTAQDQIQLQLGKDLSVDNGPKEDFRMNLRYARVF